MVCICSKEEHARWIKKGASSEKIMVGVILGYVSHDEASWRTKKPLSKPTQHPASMVSSFLFQTITCPRIKSLMVRHLTTYDYTGQLPFTTTHCYSFSKAFLQCSHSADQALCKPETSNLLPIKIEEL